MTLFDMDNMPKLEPWLIAALGDLKQTDTPDSKDLIEAGASVLTAKIADVEAYNMPLASRLKRRIPETLSFDEISAILMHMLIFKNINMSDTSDDTGILGVYTPSDAGMWTRTSLTRDTRGIYVTNNKFLQYLVRLVNPKAKTRDIEEVMANIRDLAPTVTTTDGAHLFPVKNGIFNQKTGMLEDFHPDYIYLSKMRINYVPNKQNPVIQEPDGGQWDVDSWLESLSASPEINELLWQVIAASLQPNRGMNKSIWFYSESGNNGKGTVGQLIKNLLGKGNYSPLSVSDFNHEFLKQNLIGVSANISDENDVDDFIDSVKDYKASVTGDDILINRKHKDPVRMQFRGLNIQMMNGLPKTKDRTGSFYRRLIIVPFIKSFTNNGEKGYIKDDYIHRTDVLEYTLYKALTLRFDEFTTPAESSMLIDQYKEKNNPVLDFWNELSEEFAWDLVPSQFLYDLYQKWFERTNPNGKIIGQRTFYDYMVPIIEASPEWHNNIGRDKAPISSTHRMADDEPLISEYGLDRPYRDGTPTPWMDPSYKSGDAQKKRDFTRKAKYRGIVRV